MHAAAPRPDRWTASWRASPSSIQPLRHALLRFAESVGATERAMHAIGLAASEAATNAVVHAYRDAPEPGEVVVEARVVSPGRLRVEVVDQGTGMYEQTDSPGLGLGLALICRLAEKVQIEAPPGGGTRVSMDFELDG
jgi:serine/threonine-protein kinase RsbW/stage II sporulation protein AB (anti-sigma F factor)